jgi:hypothetical protein
MHLGAVLLKQKLMSEICVHDCEWNYNTVKSYQIVLVICFVNNMCELVSSLLYRGVIPTQTSKFQLAQNRAVNLQCTFRGQCQLHAKLTASLVFEMCWRHGTACSKGSAQTPIRTQQDMPPGVSSQFRTEARTLTELYSSSSNARSKIRYVPLRTTLTVKTH